MITQNKEFTIVGMPESFNYAKESHTTYGHYYTNPEGKTYPSVITVFSKLTPFNETKSYEEWIKWIGREYQVGFIESKAIGNYISKIAMSNGTTVHSLIEGYLNGNPLRGGKIPLLAMAHFENIQPLLNNIDNIRGCEISLYSDVLRLAGKTDCIADYNGTLSIIDFKTSNKKKPESHIENYFLQATAYSKMFEERTGQKIEQIVILITCNDSSLQSFVKKPFDYYSLLDERLEKFKEIGGYSS